MYEQEGCFQLLRSLLTCAPGVYQFSVPESLELGSAVGMLKATDADMGKNAEMEYTIMDDQDMFQISTNPITQEGVITLRKVRTQQHHLTSPLHHTESSQDETGCCSFSRHLVTIYTQLDNYSISCNDHIMSHVYVSIS